MIYVENTLNNTGVAIYGDYLDFTNLYKSLHTVVGEEGEFISYDAARIRVLGVCYDLRHSMLGDREVEFVDNGMDETTMRGLSVISSTKNLYFKINALWPEILFVTVALNDFLKLYAAKKSKRKYDYFTEQKTVWDENIAMVRLFQSAMAECLKKTLTPQTSVRVLNSMTENYKSFNHYATQYIDVLNSDFFGISPEKRLKNISSIVKKMLNPSDDYYRLKLDLEEQAKRYNCSPDDLRLDLYFPETIKW